VTPIAAALPEVAKMISDRVQWFALQVRSRLASTAAVVLRTKGYEELLPLYRSRRRWCDRVKEIKLPLFPGYLFCRFDPDDHQVPVLTTPGVIGIVGAGKTPIAVSDEEIEAVRRILSSGLAAQPWPFLSVGSRIYISRGPLTGLEGIITNTDKTYRLVVAVTLLQRSVAVEIDRDWARPVTPRLDPRSAAFSERRIPRAV
jgi:transcription antitermination factor NusG